MKDKATRAIGKKNSVHLSRKISVPMILLALLQVLIFVAILALSGEFSYLKKFSYSSVSEKAENRKNYVENKFNQVVAYTNGSAKEVGNAISSTLQKFHMPAVSIASDRDIDKEILYDTADLLVGLLRKASVNDVFIILNSNGMLDEDGKAIRMGLYIRDMDINDNRTSDNADLLLEIGNSEISRNYGMFLDYEWSLYADVSDRNSFSFYYDAVETGNNNRFQSVDVLGKWSGLSRISKTSQQSIKYTVPLISEDGYVYGVMGVGLLEKTIQSSIPFNDFMNESACYIIAADCGDGNYKQIMHTGPAYGKLVMDEEIISCGNSEKYNMYDFAESTKTSCIGSIQYMNLYKSGSPFKDQKWVLIAIADKDRVLEMNITLMRVFIISLCFTLAVSIVLSFVISGVINSPVQRMVKEMEDSREKNRQVKFSSSGIIEIDELAESITGLQESILSSASSVSKIISMTGAGIGVFMYDITAGTVFLGESFIKMFDTDNDCDGDTTVSLKSFWKMMSGIDSSSAVRNSSVFAEDSPDSGKSDTVTIAFETPDSNETKWIQFNMYRKAASVMGIAQDITKSVLEKSRIEYERDYDMTTSLLNRRAFYHKFNALFMKPDKLKIAACFMFDLDNLKYVNDTYGHDYGDSYLRAAAAAFRSVESDRVLAARLSGDEFIIFCYGFESPDEIYDIREKLHEALGKSYCLLADGTHYKVRASGGISWYPKDATESDVLIKYADFAMYTVKHSTKGIIGEFDMNIYRNDSVLVTGVEELNRIIDEGAVKYALQSIVSAKTGEIYGYELLMRPQSEILGTPLEFVRMAKTDSRLNAVEYLTWTSGIKSFNEQIKKGNIKQGAKLFLNTIPNNIIDNNVITQLEHDYGECMENIVLELLESEQTNDEFIHKKKNLLKRWKGMLALDDFGTGYNSEFALLELKPDLIKLDHSLITGCDRDEVRMNMVRDIVGMAKKNNVMVLAEGVETHGELVAVIHCGVDLIQGFYLGRPLYEPVDISPKLKQEIIEAARS